MTHKKSNIMQISFWKILQSLEASKVRVWEWQFNLFVYLPFYWFLRQQHSRTCTPHAYMMAKSIDTRNKEELHGTFKKKKKKRIKSALIGTILGRGGTRLGGLLRPNSSRTDLVIRRGWGGEGRSKMTRMCNYLVLTGLILPLALQKITTC